MIGPETMVVPLQNGVEAPWQQAAQLDAGHVVAGLWGTFSWVTAPGRIRSIGASHFIKFGELDNRLSERTELLRRVFERASVPVEIPPISTRRCGTSFCSSCRSAGWVR
jgi:2-dehydropantoate 2-reductase